ncbi:putative ATP-dependent helicase [Tupanvirus deep ocean]|uniref:ATP-dependent helicase n=2 Tax=Tupanvirus TaxID=2094720 RepID=A0AC62A7B7_9VIRU|nr:putative ATP-dependent helicase [Tupanvirus deep ocean]QKU33624.1 putative ATP-dependent helicase [Tupanvirus deep ocean]
MSRPRDFDQNQKMSKRNKYYLEKNNRYYEPKNTFFSVPKKIENTKIFDEIQKLVIYPKLTEITNAIKNSMITIIRSDTGSGKTIGVPNYLSTDPYFLNNIFCSVPTVAATLSAHKYQSQICSSCENYVGYACEGNTNYDHNTKIVYCTAGHLLNKLVRTVSNVLYGNYGRYNPWFCSVLILDEFHIRSKESDICLCLWIACYKAWKENLSLPKPPKLVIMSATLDDSIINLLPTAPSILSYTIQTHPIKVVFDEESNKYNIDSDERYVRAANLALKYHNDNYNGVYLIFVPGKQEIDIVISVLDRHLGKNADLLAAHSDLSVEELMRIHQPPTVGKRKIVIATNIAECSVTIEHVSLVIDTLTHREATSSLDESICLDLHWISKSNSKQRKGRTGRTCEGIYVVLQNETKFSDLTENITPEIDRISVSYDILKLMKFKLDPKIILAPVISEWQINIYLDLLKKLGFITHNNGVTDMGDFCSEFPLSIRKAAMLYHLRNMNDPNVFLHLAIICTLNCYGAGIYIWPKKIAGEDIVSYSMRCDDAMEKLEDKYAGYSDVDTLFNIWIDICSKMNPFYITGLRIYCKENHLNFKRFKEIATLLKQCIYIGNRNYIGLKAYHNVTNFKNPDTRVLSKTFYYLLSLTHQDYETTIHHNSNGNMIARCGGLEHKIDNRSIHLMNVGNNPRQIYYSLVRTQRNTKKGIMRIVNVLHAVSDHDLDESDISIFSSDVESDGEFDDDKSLSEKENWKKFLSVIESKILPPTNIYLLSEKSLEDVSDNDNSCEDDISDFDDESPDFDDDSNSSCI